MLFVQGTKKILKNNLSKLIVYGSYARGDYKENSDIDVMILTPLSKEETEKWINYSDHFHLIFYDYCANSRLTLAAEKLRSQLTIFSNLYETQAESQHNIGQMHKQIFEAYKNGKITKAGDLMKQHLEDSLQYALSCL